MGTIVFIALVIAVAGIVWIRRVYLRINRLQAPITEAYAAIDGMLHQRAERIGQLVDMTEKAGIRMQRCFIPRRMRIRAIQRRRHWMKVSVPQMISAVLLSYYDADRDIPGADCGSAVCPYSAGDL